MLFLLVSVIALFKLKELGKLTIGITVKNMVVWAFEFPVCELSQKGIQFVQIHHVCWEGEFLELFQNNELYQNISSCHQ